MSKTSLNKTATHPLQTSYWANFRREWGNEVLETKYGIITIHRLPFTSYRIGMFIRGPKPTTKMLVDLKNIAKENKLIFIKLEPNVIINEKLKNLLENSGTVRGKTLFTPTSFQIDLTKSEDELLKSFHSKTRYNIRYAERKGVEVKEDDSKKAFEKYLQLTRETVERQGFYAHTEKYHRLMWSHLRGNPKSEARNPKPISHLLTAIYQKEIITTWILFVWKDTLYYPYGAASMKHKNVQANSLLMWEAIRFGKKLELKKFDLWGREPGKGFTKFKEGFNPNVVEFVGTWDLVINKPLYYLYRVAENVRWPFLRIKTKFSKPEF